MKVRYNQLALPLEFAFTISRSSQSVAQTVYVELTHSHLTAPAATGMGEAVPSPFYGEDSETVVRFYKRLQDERTLEDLEPHDLQKLEERLGRYPGNRAAKSGLEIAVQDLRAKMLGVPLFRLWGLDPSRVPKTSYTIGIDRADQVRHKMEAALSRGFDVIKVKLGDEKDLETMGIIREMAPEARLRVDANAGWGIDEAIAKCDALNRYDVEFVEAPLRLDSTDEDYRRLKARSPIPLMADENCHTLRDIPRCAELFHAVNLKHTKTGGLEEARRMIHAARAHDLKIMLGGFVETSISVTAMGHLAPLVDYCDLDACLLVAEDPYLGLEFQGSHFRLPDRPGIGVVPRSE